jgi:hypothetical protein
VGSQIAAHLRACHDRKGPGGGERQGESPVFFFAECGRPFAFCYGGSGGAALRFTSAYRSFSLVEDFGEKVRTFKPRNVTTAFDGGARHHRSPNRAGSPRSPWRAATSWPMIYYRATLILG